MSGKLTKQQKKNAKNRAAKREAKIVQQIEHGGKIKGKGDYSLSDIVSGVKNAVSKVVTPFTYEPSTGVGKAASRVAERLADTFEIPGAKYLGNAAGWFTKLLGFGDYKVQVNSLMGQTWRPSPEQSAEGNSPPLFQSVNGSTSDVVLVHREFVGNVLSSINFRATTVPVNAGSNVLFPWLSRMASLYEEYQFLGLVFEYKSTSATAVGTTSSAMGTVIMATDYDCYDNAFQTKRAMEAAEFSVSGAPYDHFMAPIECDPRRNNSKLFFVNYGITDFTQAKGDARNEVMCNFTYATEGQQAADTVIGELWVTYHVRLSRPILESAAPSSTYTQHVYGVITTAGVATLVGNSYIGSASFTPTIVGTGAGLRLKLASVSPLLLKGQYMIVVRCQTQGVSTTITLAAPTTPGWINEGGMTYPTHGYSVSGVANAGLEAWAIANSSTASFSTSPHQLTSAAIVETDDVGDATSVNLYYCSEFTMLFDCWILPFNASVSVTETLQQKVERLERELQAQNAEKVKWLQAQSVSSSSRDPAPDEDEPGAAAVSSAFAYSAKQTKLPPDGWEAVLKQKNGVR